MPYAMADRVAHLTVWWLYCDGLDLPPVAISYTTLFYGMRFAYCDILDSVVQ